MDIIKKIIHEIPLFRHCSGEEIAWLRQIGKLSAIKKGQIFDVKKGNSFNIIINGIFEIEAPGHTDIVYLAPGSFFGSIPFSDNKHSGTIKALMESTLMIFDEGDMYKFFLASYKGLRGYIKIIERMGFEISGVGKKYFGNNSKILSIYSPDKESGKSFFASLLALSLSTETGGNNKTIVLDLSYQGNSIFNFFEKKVSSPLSHKKAGSSPPEKMINERIEHIHENLDLLNISFGSKVKVDPAILSPILFILSKEYKYIILDISNHDPILRDATLRLSDTIFTLLKKTKDLSRVYTIFDTNLKEGQRVYYTVNEQYAGDIKKFEGGLVLGRYDWKDEESRYTRLLELTKQSPVDTFIKLITQKRKGLALETNLLNSIFFSGFFSVLEKSGISYDVLYSSSMSYMMIAFYLLSKDEKDLKKSISSFFSGDKINSFLNITFPGEHVFKKNSISKFAKELCRNKRLEIFEQLPLALVSGSKGDTRMFSTGYLKDIVATSFLIDPVFESEEIAGDQYSSGYPFQRIRAEELFRTDLDEITYISINNKENMRYPEGRVLDFYDKYVGFLEQERYDEKISTLAHKNLVMEVSQKELKIEKIMELSEEITNKLLNIK
ncbi:MAG: hypothetical protein GY754_07020 [bacterium]|nr:hypothetical protein [bacterium]